MGYCPIALGRWGNRRGARPCTTARWGRSWTGRGAVCPGVVVGARVWVCHHLCSGSRGPCAAAPVLLPCAGPWQRSLCLSCSVCAVACGLWPVALCCGNGAANFRPKLQLQLQSRWRTAEQLRLQLRSLALHRIVSQQCTESCVVLCVIIYLYIVRAYAQV